MSQNYSHNYKDEFKILLVEDQDSFREAVYQLLSVYNPVQEARSLGEAREKLQKKAFGAVILDKCLPDGDGIDLIPEIKCENPNAIVIILTADNDFNSVKKCLEAGADDYVVKSENVIPDLLIRIPLAVAKASISRRLSNLQDQVKKAFRYELVGNSRAASELRLSISAQKGSQASILITGESGAGKEVIARRLHAVESQPHRPFVDINCAAIPEALIESELFGHKRGAFTGANVDQPGKFELAHGGDLFLDEVGELSPQAQSKLLRVLEQRQFYRVGGTKIVDVSCRVIAATNRNLEELVRKKRFREDLYYRLNVARFHLPPLRSRTEDIPDLVRFLVLRGDFPTLTVTESACEKLQRHDWPGNIRELGNVVARGAIAAKKRKSVVIDEVDIQIDGPLDATDSVARRIEMSLPSQVSDLSGERFKEYLGLVEREYLKKVLALHSGNVTAAAASIEMSRSNLFRKITALELGNKVGNEESTKGVFHGLKSLERGESNQKSIRSGIEY